MEDVRLVYEWTQGLTMEAVAEAVRALGKVRSRPDVTVQRTFLDTFDWRVFRKGEALEGVDDSGGARLVWRKLLGRDLRSSAVFSPPLPRFASDLPAGGFQRALAALVEMRALLPVARVQTHGQALELLGAREKVVCRIWLESHTCIPLHGRRRLPLPPTVRAEPVRGYERPLEEVLQVLSGTLSMVPAEADVLSCALAAGGVVPSDHSTKVRVALRPEMPAAEAGKLLFRRLLDTLLDNEGGTKSDVDSEFLHDFRVSVRRTRSALGQFKGAFPARAVERFRREFAWLGSVTTPTRDLDVHVLAVPHYRESLPASARADLDPLLAFLHLKKSQAQAALRSDLESRRYGKLVQAWTAALETDGMRPSRSGRRPVRELADERLRKVFRRTVAEGRSLGEGSPPEAFHELRKSCKKLRYLMEFFQSLYPAEELHPFIEALKGLQDNLGELQDVHVQSEALRGWAEEMGKEGPSRARTLLAMGMWLEKLAARRTEIRREFGRAFGRFADPENAARLRSLLRGKGDAE